MVAPINGAQAGWAQAGESLTQLVLGALHRQEVVGYFLAAGMDPPSDRLSPPGGEFIDFQSCECNEEQLSAAPQKLRAQCRWNDPAEILST